MMLGVFSCTYFQICTSSLEKCLFKFFAGILIGLYVFILLNCRNSFYILSTSLLSVIWFANISSILRVVSSEFWRHFFIVFWGQVCYWGAQCHCNSFFFMDWIFFVILDSFYVICSLFLSPPPLLSLFLSAFRTFIFL